MNALQKAYGVVWKAVEKKTRKTVALKKCFDAFRNEVDAQRTYREVQYLKELSKPSPHENIITLLTVIKAENDRDIYLVFDFMGKFPFQVFQFSRDVECSYAVYRDGLTRRDPCQYS